MSALNIPIWQGSVTATAAISKGQAVSYAGAVAAPDAAIFGIALHDAEIGERVQCNRMGLAAAKAGATISAAGVELEVGTTGRLIPIDSGVGVARSMGAASADDDIEVTLVSH